MFQPAFRGRFAAVCSILAVVLFASPASAQIGTGIHGIVKDSSGAVVPKTALKLTDTATNIVRETVSSGEGTFVFVNLPAGTFTLAATARRGFQASVLPDRLWSIPAVSPTFRWK